MKLAGIVRTLIAVGSTLACGLSFAQAYPTKPIRLVMPYAAGQSTDISGRILAKYLGDNLGQPVIVENRQGADGVIGTTYVANAAPDGYTLLMGTSGQFGAAVALYKDLPYDPVKDFAPITRLFTVFYILTVGGDHQANTVADLVAMARKSPGKLTIANTAGIAYLTGELLKQAAGIDMLDVPQKTTAQAIADLTTGRVDTMFISPAAAMPLIKAGKFKALAITAPKRSVLTPGVPTLVESGFPGLISTPSPALFAPARTPKDIIAKLHTETVAVLRDPKVKEVFLKNGTSDSELVGGTPEELAAFVAAELEMWGRVAKLGIRRRD